MEIHCPRCQQVVAKEGNPYWPFCSERCKLLDLGAWAKEEYRVPGSDIVSAEVVEITDEYTTEIEATAKSRVKVSRA